MPPFSSNELYSPLSLPSNANGRPGSLELDDFPPRSRLAKGKQAVSLPLDDDDDDHRDHSTVERDGLLGSGPSPPSDLDSDANPGPSSSASAHGKGLPPAPSTKWGSTAPKMTKLERAHFVREMWTETLPILLLSLMGSVFTGMLLEKLQLWGVFIRIEELFILVPILLNLKGNLEMNLAARFSTSANIGELDLRLTRRSLVFGNMALLQVQALLVSLLSGLLSFILGMLARNGVHHALQHPIHNPSHPDNAAAGGTGVTDALRGGYFEALLLLCVSMLAASISSAVLGTFMCALVIVCRNLKINPDNIATPLASSLGDLVTLVILGVLSNIFASLMGTLVSTAVFLLLLFAVAVNLVITFRNAYVQELLSVGWGPLFAAMAISSGSGLILETYVNEFAGFALFAPVFTSITGNSAAVFVSRISTALHSSRREHYWVVSSALFVVTAPVLLLFLGFVWLTGQAEVTWVFTLVFAVVTCIQLALSLGSGYYLALLLWRWDYDPDVYALPILTSLLDVSGQFMLVVAFSIARRMAGPGAPEDVTIPPSLLSL